MRAQIVVVVFVAFGVVSAKEDCVRNGRGLCELTCPPGAFIYSPGCGPDIIAMSRRSCSEPVAKPMGNICDIRRCDCYKPKVWDDMTQQCVNLPQCSCQGLPPTNDDRL